MTTNSHLQLCVNDLLHPTEKSESLLEALTSSQLEEIEKTLSKIKNKKQTTQNGKYSKENPFFLFIFFFLICQMSKYLSIFLLP
jgi:ribosome-associated translation inhibitor RaiA